MRAREAHPLESVDLTAGAQQIGEGTAVTEFDAVGIDVLPQQGDLDDAVGHESLHLREDVAGAAILLLAAQGGHDAKGAAVIAPDTDGHPGGVRRLAARGQGGGEDLETLQDLDLRLLGDARPLQEHRQGTEVVGAEDRIDPGGAADHLTAVLLREAATHGDLHARVSGLDRCEMSEVAVEPVIGVLPHRTGVEDDQISLIAVWDADIAGRFEDAGDALGVMSIHLAPVGAHLKRPGHRLRVRAP